jgi:integrase
MVTPDAGRTGYLDSRQTAALLGICLRTLSNLRNRQIIPFVRVGRQIRYRREALESTLTGYSVSADVDAGASTPAREYTGMRRRSKKWPRTYERTYKDTGAVVYGIDLGKQGGKKRDRRVFSTKEERDRFVQQMRAACEEQGQLPFYLPWDVQSSAIKLFEFLKPHNISLDDVRRHYAEDVIPYNTAPNVPEIADKLMVRIERKYLHRRRTKWPGKLRGFLNEFGRRFPGKITEIKEEDLEEFCFRGDKPETERSRRAMAAQLFNFAIKKTWAKINVANNLDMPVLEVKEPVFLNLEDVQRLLSVADEYGLLGYFVLGFFLGIRPEELEKLDWSDVDMEDGTVVIYAAAAKINQRRELEINKTLAAWLRLCIRDSRPIADPVNFDDRFDKCRAAAGLLDGWVQDVVRHSFATYHAGAYQKLEETARLMGHIGGLRVLKKHYVAYVPKRIARQFWALRPTSRHAVRSTAANGTEVARKAA